MKTVLLTCAFLLFGAEVSAQSLWLKHPRWFRVGLVCSSSADAYDAISTAFFVGRDNGLSEGNALLEQAARSPWKLTAVKVGGALAINYSALYLKEPHPKIAGALLFGNCVGKTIIGARNERLQRAIDARAR